MTGARLTLDAAVTTLAGVGPRIAERLQRLGIITVRDVIYHLPLRYQDRTQITPLNRLMPKLEVVVAGRIMSSQIQFGRRRSLLVHIEDDDGRLALRFFYFNREQQLKFSVGRNLRCFGEVRRGPKELEMVHPECRVEDELSPTALDTVLTPVYPTTEGLHQLTWRKLSSQALAILERDHADAEQLDELIARSMPTARRLPDLRSALRYVHRPPVGAVLETLREGTHPTQQRLAIEELLAHQMSLRQLRAAARRLMAPPCPTRGELTATLRNTFGFKLTGAQQRVAREIESDLKRDHPMLRLLQGDVGAGKTAVAALAASHVLANGFQVALLAPTELLAEQHLRTLTRWFEPAGVEVFALTGRMTAPARRRSLARLTDAAPCLVVGTHALFQNDVQYANLALVIVDEQHRFGVDQRLALLDKGARDSTRPHQLIMTATPIPRTLAMTAYADLDVSILDELPPQRRPVQTLVISETRRSQIVDRISAVCAGGRQAYWVCPLIDESELVDHQAATDTAAELTQALPHLRIGLVHGRLKEQAKSTVMQAFVQGEIDLLVATTVIEVGVDVPNASLMIIENAERLGLAQLHQLRGRVGRGEAQSNCVLLYKGPLSETARLRLQTMRETTDGFLIAEQDLILRGPGEVLGTRQTGAASFKIADLSRDRHLLPMVRTMADHLLRIAPALAERLMRRWLTNRMDYAKV